MKFLAHEGGVRKIRKSGVLFIMSEMIAQVSTACRTPWHEDIGPHQGVASCQTLGTKREARCDNRRETLWNRGNSQHNLPREVAV